jgi:SDR family mycofactocin-dependent oxidoreductase
MGRLDGKVALVTGAARGQGRNHAVKLAEEGADILAIDLGHDLDGLAYPMGTADDLATTAALVEQAGRRCLSGLVDVRDHDGLRAFVDAGVRELGHLDVAVANAGVCSTQRFTEITPELWGTVIGINLTGVFNTCASVVPHLVAAGGGSLVLISSTAGSKGLPFVTPYVAAKHGVVGLMRSLANEFAEAGVRVNSLHPTGVDTPMLGGMAGLAGYLAERPDLGPLFMNALPDNLIGVEDVTNALLFLASDESRAVTGLTLAVDAGAGNR